jgi:hypothetical protein
MWAGLRMWEDNRVGFILISTPKSSEWSISFRFYHNSVNISLLVYTLRSESRCTLIKGVGSDVHEP